MTHASPPADLPLVSVVSAYYNRVESVTGSIGSLLAQTYPNLEIIVVDDGSTDGTRAALEQLSDPRIRIISRANMGFTPSINEAIRASSGEFVAIHGSGDFSLPERIAAQATILRARPDVGVVGCWVDNDEDDGSGTRLFKAPDGLNFQETLKKRNLFTHGEVMFRRSLYDRVGGYREFFRFSQDFDLWLRMAAHMTYAIVPKILYRRFKGEDGVSTDPKKLLLQAYLHEFALQCGRERAVRGRDSLDEQGYMAGFMRDRSPELARRLAWIGAKWMVRGDEVRGWELIVFARSEWLSRQVAIIYGLARLHRSPVLWKRIGRPVLQYRLASFHR